MRISELAKIIDGKPAGEFFRLKYRTEVPMSKEYRETHPEPVFEIVEATVRTGCNYGNLGAVKAKAETAPTQKKPRVNNFSALIPDRIYFNQKTGKYYLYVYPTENDNRKQTLDHNVDPADMKEYVRPLIKKIITDHILEVG